MVLLSALYLCVSVCVCVCVCVSRVVFLCLKVPVPAFFLCHILNLTQFLEIICLSKNWLVCEDKNLLVIS